MGKRRLLSILILCSALVATLGITIDHTKPAFAANNGCPSNGNDNPNNWNWTQVAVTNASIGGESVAATIQIPINPDSFGGGVQQDCGNVFRSTSVVNMTYPGGQIITNTYGFGSSFCDPGSPCPTFVQNNWYLPNQAGQIVAYASGMVFGSCSVANMYFENVLTQVRYRC